MEVLQGEFSLSLASVIPHTKVLSVTESVITPNSKDGVFIYLLGGFLLGKGIW